MRYGIRLGSENSDWIHSNTIEDYFSEIRKNLVSENDQLNIKSLVSISNLINSGGNLILGSYNTGKNDKIGKYLVGLSSTLNLNVYANQGLTDLITYDNYYVPKSLFNTWLQNSSDAKWGQYTKNGITYFDNISINKNGTITTK